MKLPSAFARPRAWLDPRFMIGLLLVAASVAGVVFVVGAFDRSSPVFVASGPLRAGQLIDAADLGIASVSMGAAAAGYLDPASMPDDGVVVTRTIAEGELIPLSAVGSAASADLATIVVELSGRVGADVLPGAVVDLWSAVPAEKGGFETPTVLVGSASVVGLVEEDGFMVSKQGVSVELQLPSGSVSAVLEAIADESSLALVAVNTPLGR